MERGKCVMLIVTVCLVALLSGGAAHGEAVELQPVATLELDPGSQDWVGFSGGHVWDGYLYLNTATEVGWCNGGIVIVDVQDPTQPAAVTYYEGYYTGLTAFSGHYMYLFKRDPSLNGSNHALEVIDISDPAAPAVANSLSVSYRVWGIEIYGSYAYVLSFAHGLYVFDISDPTQPSEVAWLPTSGHQLALVPPQDGAEPGAGPLLYVHDARYDVGLHAISALDPTAPYVIDSTAAYEPEAMCSVGAALAVIDAGDLVLLDGSAPFTEIGTHELDLSSIGPPALRPGPGIRHVYASAYYASDFQVLDVSTPSAPVQVAHCETGFAGAYMAPTPEHIYVIGRDSVSEVPTLVVTDALKVFTDVTWASWAAAPIDACVGAAIVGGYTDGSYQPRLPVSRDQMAVFISRALAGGDENVPDGPIEATFEDVPVEHWAFDYVEACVADGVVQGYDAVTYGPSVAVNRGAMSVFISRAVAGGDEAVPDGPAEPTFADVPSGHWAYRYVEYCAAAEIVQGYDPVTYGPTITVSRDQMAVYISRAFELE